VGPPFRMKNYSLSYAQLSLWYEILYSPGENSYLFFARIRSRVPFSSERLEHTIRRIVQRHPQLLMRLQTGGSSVHQTYGDFSGVRTCSGDWNPESGSPIRFSLDDAPLFSVSLVQEQGQNQGQENTDLILSWHHLVGDAWSFGVLFNDFIKMYYEDRELPPIPVNYGDFVRFQEEWIAGPEGRRGAEYWENELRNLVPLRDLCSVSAQKEVRNSKIAVRRIPVSFGLNRKFTPFEYVLAAWCTVLSDYTGRSDLPVLVPFHGRPKGDFYKVVGHFVNPSLIRVCFDGLETFTDLLGQVRRKINNALKWQMYPFLLVADSFTSFGGNGSAPFTEAFCGMVRLPRGLPVADEATGSPLKLMDIRQTGNPRQLCLDLCEGNGSYYLEIRYPEDLWDTGSIDTLSALLAKIIRAAVKNPGIGISDLPHMFRSRRFKNRTPAAEIRQKSEAVVRKYAAPATATEESLLEIWQEVLSCSTIGADENFFSLGGHSLSATQVMTRVLEEFKVSLPLGTLFREKTVRALARCIDNEKQSFRRTPVYLSAAVPPGKQIPLSFSQERMWFIHQLEPESAAYNIHVALRLRGPLDKNRLSEAFRLLQERHEILRTTFHDNEGTPFQVVHAVPLSSLLTLSLNDLSGETADRKISLAREIAETEAAFCFNLQQGPLIRMSVLQTGENDHILMLNLHHIIGDQWSLGVISRELTALYTGEKPAPLRLQYRDFIFWQREEYQKDRWEEDLQYWKSALQSMPIMELPTDYPRPPVQTYRGGTARTALADVQQYKIRSLALEMNVTPYMLMLSVFAVLLRRLSESEEIPIGTPVANRMLPAFEELIGTFVNTLVLRIPVNEDQTFAGFLVRVREIVLEAFERQNYPFEKLVEVLNPERDTSRLPLAQVLFNMVNTPQDSAFDDELDWELFPLEHGGVQFDITLSIDLEISGEIQLQFNEDLFLRETGERFLLMYRTLLGAALEEPEICLTDLPLMSRLELEKVLFRRNNTWRDYSLELPLIDLLFAEARKHPESTAIKFHGERFSFRDLFQAAGRLANLLRSRNLGEGSVVGLHLHRSPRLVSALLGIAASGAAYLPLDPGYPRARLEFMLEQSGADVLLKEALNDPDVTVMQATPSTWRMLLEAGWKGPLQTLLCGGEAFPPDLVQPLLDASENLWNMYGPTETTVWSTMERLASAANPIPIGRPIANTSLYFIDSRMRPVPDGVRGELHIGGAGLALGYRRRPDLTRDAFIPHPFTPGEFLYHTGDLARMLPNGALVCLGRTDTQVKFNGHRIELAEIEKRLSCHPEIAQAVCRVISCGPGDSRLAAYCIPASPGDGLPDPAALQSYLEESLPRYMVPGIWIPMESFPLTANGKIDRGSFPRKPEAEVTAVIQTIQEHDESFSGTERRVYSLWKTLLKTGPFGRADDFFTLGGHSLLAVALVAVVGREFGVVIPLRSFFSDPTVRGTARRVEELLGNLPAGVEENDVLFIMQRYGQKPPLFIIAGVYAQENGLYRFLSSLVPHLGNDQPVYGLRPRGLLRSAPDYSGIEEMASEYLEQVRAIRPRGPYWFIGECIGGVVAYEMARRLVQNNEQVCLIMLDTEYPSRLRRLRYLAYYRTGRLAAKLRRSVSLAVRNPLAFVRRGVSFSRYKLRSAFPGTGEEKERRRFRKVELRYSRLVYRYSFPCLDSTAYLLANEEGSRYVKNLGWDAACRNGGARGPRELKIQKVPGNHITRITEYGSELGTAIRRILDENTSCGFDAETQ
jgi:non-ribosomal peptide synthetase component F/thioesterase domain-containing protein